VIGARLEERKLINQFGKEYTDYMKEVPGLIPRFWEK
jgi:protein-S-isoprenylcysteine O-methyltransferase Ste14